MEDRPDSLRELPSEKLHIALASAERQGVAF